MSKKENQKKIVGIVCLIVAIFAIFVAWQLTLFKSDIQGIAFIPPEHSYSECPIGATWKTKNICSGDVCVQMMPYPNCEAWMTPLFKSLGI